MEPKFLSGFLGILRESQVIFLKNRQLMTFISLLIILLHSFLMLCIYFSSKAILKNLVMKETMLFLTDPKSSEHAHILIAIGFDIRVIAGLEWFFVLALSIFSLFSTTATILASAITYGELSLSLKELLSRTMKLWKRPTVTWFYITLFDCGYVIFSFFTFLPFILNFSSPSRPSTFSHAIMIPVAIFYFFLAVVWNLSHVIAVLEEKSGLEAIGKAAELVKGMKWQGFLLNVLFGILAFVVCLGWRWTYIKSETLMVLVTLVLLNLLCLIKMAAFMAFTVLYLICKQNHGEEMELEGSLEYVRAPTEALIRVETP